MSFVFQHESELDAALARPDFSVEIFRQQALARDEAAYRDWVGRQHLQAALWTGTVATLPPLMLYVAGLSVAWSIRRFHATTERLLRLAIYVAGVAAFVCLWLAASQRPELFTSGQWGLLGGTLLATAGVLWWRQRI